MRAGQRGHVYVLDSPNCPYIKIGGTDHAPMKRLKEINGVSPYRELGPWSLADFRQVKDWRKIEAHLHYVFRSALVTEVAGQKELFAAARHLVSARLQSLDPDDVISKPKVDRLFQDADCADYLTRLFAFSGLLHWIDLQGAWVLTLFPATAGGRYFTISIGRHEVAFATLPGENEPRHHIVLDQLILDFPRVRTWLRARNGDIAESPYASALPRAVSVYFFGSFSDAAQLLQLDGVRRALIAYWAEALYGMKERDATSFFARFHDYNAVAEILSRSRASFPRR